VDRSGTERTGFNQTICPLDVDESGPIKDTYLHTTLVKPLPQVRARRARRQPRRRCACAKPAGDSAAHACANNKYCPLFWIGCRCALPSDAPPPAWQGATLHALVDSCHSGTILNLPYNAVTKAGKFEHWSNEYPTEKLHKWVRISPSFTLGLRACHAPLGREGLRPAAAITPRLPAPQNTNGGTVYQFSAAKSDEYAKECASYSRGGRCVPRFVPQVCPSRPAEAPPCTCRKD
jgi:hypothetical protein